MEEIEKERKGRKGGKEKAKVEGKVCMGREERKPEYEKKKNKQKQGEKKNEKEEEKRRKKEEEIKGIEEKERGKGRSVGQ